VIGLELLVSDDYELIRNHIQSRKLAFYFGYLPDGYGWIFPRQEDASVGIGVTMKYAQRARALFSDFVNSIGLPRELAAKAKGHPIPLFSPFDRGPICRKNILLTGDAASFVDPITGEGIYYALKSGELAARALIESMPEGRKAAPGYKAAVERAFLGELRAAWKISLPLYAFPGAGFDLFRTSERIRKLHFDVIAGRASYTDLVKEVPRAGLLLVKSFFSRKS
jgi:flavin-dependent dehydrogenase